MLLRICIISHCNHAKMEIIQFVNNLDPGKGMQYDKTVAASEKETGFRNAALVNFLKNFGTIHNSPEDVLDVYNHQCSIHMSCLEVAEAFLIFADESLVPRTKTSMLTPRQVKRVNSLMMTCGLYDAVGEFAYSVGLPGKSGIGGGIATVIPRKFATCVWSPELDSAGNSLVGVQIKKSLQQKLRCQYFNN